MSAQHTPAPWIAMEWACHAVTTVRAGDITVAECSGHGRLSIDCEADAILIAAAPDLLAALIHALRWHDQLNPVDIAAMRAAIAKATGRAS